MHRFFVNSNSWAENHILFEAKEAHHMQKVLRLKPGDMIIGFDGKGNEYRITLLAETNDGLRGVIEEICQKETEPNVLVHLVQGIAKADKMDTIIQKAVEIGIHSIYPVTTSHTVVRLKEDKRASKITRWQTIAREACKQCRRNYIPEVKPLLDFAAFLKNRDRNKAAIMLYENEHLHSLGEAIKTHLDLIQTQGAYLIVGPEGGFSDAEVESAREQGVITAGLGPRILRTETAGLAAASMILYAGGVFDY